MKIIFMLLFLASCSKELKYSKEALFALAKEGDPSLTFVLPSKLDAGVHCSDYSNGCLAGHTVKVKGLNLIAVEFATEADAIYCAKQINGYYVRNWVLDDATGEPKLERFVVETLKAKKP